MKVKAAQIAVLIQPLRKLRPKSSLIQTSRERGAESDEVEEDSAELFKSIQEKRKLKQEIQTAGTGNNLAKSVAIFVDPCS